MITVDLVKALIEEHPNCLEGFSNNHDNYGVYGLHQNISLEIHLLSGCYYICFECRKLLYGFIKFIKFLEE